MLSKITIKITKADVRRIKLNASFKFDIDIVDKIELFNYHYRDVPDNLVDTLVNYAQHKLTRLIAIYSYRKLFVMKLVSLSQCRAAVGCLCTWLSLPDFDFDDNEMKNDYKVSLINN